MHTDSGFDRSLPPQTALQGPFGTRQAAEAWAEAHHPEDPKPAPASEAAILPRFPRYKPILNLQTETTTLAPPRPRLDLLPTAPLEEVARVLAHGAEKYGTYNWCNGTRWGRPYRALLSHAWAWWRGEDTDPESGLSHLAHCICNLLFLFEYQRNGWGEDDRFRAPTGAPFKKNDGLE
jgi:hypothetical protein